MPKLGLALSGGGFRATLYHLGVVRFLRDAGVLRDVTDIASVSGGSILAAHLVLNWERYSGDDDEFFQAAAEIVKFVRFDVRNHIVRRLPMQFPLRLLAKLRFLEGRHSLHDRPSVRLAHRLVGDQPRSGSVLRVPLDDRMRAGEKSEEEIAPQTKEADSIGTRNAAHLERPLKLRVKSRTFVVGDSGERVVRLPPGKLKAHAEGLIHIPEEIGVERRVEAPLQARHGRYEVAVERIVDAIAGMAVQAWGQVNEYFQPTSGRPDTLAGLRIDGLKDAAVVGTQCLARVELSHHAEEVIHLPAEVRAESPDFRDDPIDHQAVDIQPSRPDFTNDA